MNVEETIKKYIPESAYADYTNGEDWGGFSYIETIPDLINIICWISEQDKARYIVHIDSLKGGKPHCFKFPPFEGEAGTEHRHDYIELTYVEKGKFGQRIAGKDEVFKKGEIFLIDRDTLYNDYLFNDNSVILFFAISNNFFDRSSFLNGDDRNSFKYIKETVLARKEKYKFIRFSPKKRTTKTQSLFAEILKERLEGTPGYEDVVVGYIKRLLDLIVSEYNISLSKSEHAHYNEMLFADIKDYISDHYATVTAKELSKHFFYTPEHIYRIIKEYTGLSYSKYLQKIRLKNAQKMLMETDLPVDEIARRVGYTNTTFFYDIFAEKFGCTPKEMRTAGRGTH